MYNQEIMHQESALYNPTEKLYFSGLILYILLHLQYETQWDYGSGISWAMKMIIFFLLFMQSILSFPHYKQPIEKTVYILSLVITCVVGVNAGSRTGENYLYDLSIVFMLVFGAINIDFRKIVKIYLIVGGIYCTVTVFASFMGIIPNLKDVDTRDPEEAIGIVEYGNRMSLGYGWSTNMANHVFFILLAYFYWVHRWLKKKEMLLFLIITIGVFNYTNSRLSTLCVLMMLVVTMLYKNKIGKKLLINKYAGIFLIFCIPLFAYISYYVTDAFNERDLKWMMIDVLLSGRLSLGKEAFETAGIPLWGQFYEMFGSVRDYGAAYNYLDNSYVQLLVINGLIYTGLLVIAYMYIMKEAYRRRDFLLMYSIFFAGVSGLIAQHFIEMYMNPFLIALFAKHTRIDGNA